MANLIRRYRDADFHEKLNTFALSRKALAIEFFLSVLIVIFDFEINGVAIFGYIGIVMLLLCSDITVILPPLLLTAIFACECYDSSDKFLSFIIPEAVILIISLIIHTLLYAHKFHFGKSFKGLVAVSVAVTFSGLFCIGAGDYFKPSSLYYTVFLGIGMVGIYCLISSLSDNGKSRDRISLFCRIMYSAGLFSSFCVFAHYIKGIDAFLKAPGIIDFQSSNNLSTYIMICLPFAFLYTVKKSKIHLLSAGVMLLSLLISGSSGGMLMGSILFLICLCFAAVYDKKYRIMWIVFLFICIVSGVAFSGFVLEKHGFYSLSDVFYSNNSRMRFLKRSLSDFLSHPIFGVGLCYSGNTDIYIPRAGAMNWYHMMIPQIIGSMGTLGILAYGYQLYIRIKLSLKRLDTESVTLTLSYIGLFLMSQVNPGEFCPIPYALIGVLLYMFLERREKCTFRQYLQKN